jgi:prepilin-type processing-associated H-X9-DG protein
VELLVVIGIIVILIAMLLPALNRAREQSNAVVCMSNLKQIGLAMLTYSQENKGHLFNARNGYRWYNVYSPTALLDPNDPTPYGSSTNASENTMGQAAYWGAAYVMYGTATQKLFLCPSAQDVAGDGGYGVQNCLGSGNTPYVPGIGYTCYSINSVGGQQSGWKAADRTIAFGTTAAQDALYILDPQGSGQWVGRPLTSLTDPAHLIVCQDGYEQQLDGNGDIFYNWYQWTNPDRSGEYLRHNKKSNCLFADWHVDAMVRGTQGGTTNNITFSDLRDIRYYTGVDLWPQSSVPAGGSGSNTGQDQ